MTTMRRDAGQYAATKVSTVAFCHAVFTLRGRAKTQDVFTFDLSHAIVAFYSRDLCMVTLKSFSALRFLPVTLLPDSNVAGLHCIQFHAAFWKWITFALLISGTIFQYRLASARVTTSR